MITLLALFLSTMIGVLLAFPTRKTIVPVSALIGIVWYLTIAFNVRGTWQGLAGILMIGGWLVGPSLIKKVRAGHEPSTP